MRQHIGRLSFGLAFLAAVFASQALAQKPQQIVGASTKLAPALATDGNWMYIAWVDSSTGDIYYASENSGFTDVQPVGGTNSDGTTWSAESSATPAWGYDGVSFYLIWKGKAGNDIWFSQMSDGVWQLQEKVQGSDPTWTAETNVAPAATFNSWPLTVYWKGGSGDNVWTSSLDDLQPGWLTQSKTGLQTNVAPCVESDPNGSEGSPMVIKGASNNYIYASGFQISGKGPTWNAETSEPPAAAFDGENDVVFWKGQSGTSIWYSYNTGTPLGSGGPPTWTKQQTVSGAKTNAAPTVAIANGPSISVALVAWKNASDDSIWYNVGSSFPELVHAMQSSNP
ncbi:MAG TPA: hypothetical protein VN875_00805 [Candidatus Binatus sp.]|nr:hypothetical protein [Candidatus Binatus sp.]